MRQNPHVPERTADGVMLMMTAAKPRMDALLAQAHAISQRVLVRMHNIFLQDQAAEDAMLSGAMPGEFNRTELDLSRL